MNKRALRDVLVFWLAIGGFFALVAGMVAVMRYFDSLLPLGVFIGVAVLVLSYGFYLDMARIYEERERDERRYRE